jgi:tetrahydromethanopterin S-methyltransferase subunit B
MNDEEIERKIHIAGFVGAVFGFASGAGMMTLVAIIF